LSVVEISTPPGFYSVDGLWIVTVCWPCNETQLGRNTRVADSQSGLTRRDNHTSPITDGVIKAASKIYYF
jgi:hypothetical protein